MPVGNEGQLFFSFFSHENEKIMMKTIDKNEINEFLGITIQFVNSGIC